MTIRILGAGVSGMSTAINLALDGYDVEVYEKEGSIGSNMVPNMSALKNYDVLGNENIIDYLKKFNIEISCSNKINRTYRYSPSLHVTEYHSRRSPIYYCVYRGPHDSLETSMAETAGDIGVNIITKYKGGNEQMDVIATGASNPDILLYGGIFKNVSIEKDAAYILFDNNLAPHGYLYILPHDEDCATIVSMSFFTKRSKKELQVTFNKGLRKNRILNEITRGSTKINTIFGSQG